MSVCLEAKESENLCGFHTQQPVLSLCLACAHCNHSHLETLESVLSCHCNREQRYSYFSKLDVRFEMLLKVSGWCIHVGIHLGVILESQGALGMPMLISSVAAGHQCWCHQDRKMRVQNVIIWNLASAIYVIQQSQTLYVFVKTHAIDR